MDRTLYRNIHHWLVSHYGLASKCEMVNCPGKILKFEWALKNGQEHGRDRERYWQLCVPCHRSYDRNHNEQAEPLLSKPLLVRFSPEQRLLISQKSKKLKISEAEYVRRCVEKPALTMLEVNS